MIGDNVNEGHGQEQSDARIEFAEKILDKGKSSDKDDLFKLII
jgi:hypothetical protein